jgi:hypothetical protein
MGFASFGFRFCSGIPLNALGIKGLTVLSLLYRLGRCAGFDGIAAVGRGKFPERVLVVYSSETWKNRWNRETKQPLNAALR